VGQLFLIGPLALRAKVRRLRHPCIDKPSAVTDIGLQISETFRDLKIEQQLAPTREALSSAFSAGSTNFLKAVDGIKGRWPVQRSSSSNSARSESSTSTGSGVVVASVSEGSKADASSNGTDAQSPKSPTPTPTSAAPTSPPRPPSVVAAQVTSDAKAALGAWGTGIGTFFSSRASRFSLSRNSASSVPTQAAPVPLKEEDKSKDAPEVQSPKVKADSETLADADSSGETVVAGEHKGGDAAQGE
jgi:hypothetical protein